MNLQNLVDSPKRQMELNLKGPNKRIKVSASSWRQSDCESTETNVEKVMAITTVVGGKVESPKDPQEIPKNIVIVQQTKNGSLLEALQSSKSSNSDTNMLDLSQNAADLPVTSSAYSAVPVEDFGAALLRGMGWTGSVDEKSSYKDLKPRQRGLGLGASLASAKSLVDRSRFKNGDIVHFQLDKTACRGAIIQASGVPGLNKVRIKIEGSTRIMDVDRGSVRRVSSSELSEHPFKCGEIEETERSNSIEYQMPNHEAQRTDRVVSKSANCELSVKKIHVSRPKETIHWLQQGIRVKIISKKVGGTALYLQKGIVVDVPFVGLASVKIDRTGSIMEVKEKYLETVLPQIGAHCLVLSGEHRGSTAILFDKNDETGCAKVRLNDTLDIVDVVYDSVSAIL